MEIVRFESAARRCDLFIYTTRGVSYLLVAPHRDASEMCHQVTDNTRQRSVTLNVQNIGICLISIYCASMSKELHIGRAAKCCGPRTDDRCSKLIVIDRLRSLCILEILDHETPLRFVAHCWV